jgi:hypothetical protein
MFRCRRPGKQIMPQLFRRGCNLDLDPALDRNRFQRIMITITITITIRTRKPDGEASKLDAILCRFILMPMIVADSQCFKSRAVAGFKQLSVFSPTAFVFAAAANF